MIANFNDDNSSLLNCFSSLLNCILSSNFALYFVICSKEGWKVKYSFESSLYGIFIPYRSNKKLAMWLLLCTELGEEVSLIWNTISWEEEMFDIDFVPCVTVIGIIKTNKNRKRKQAALENAFIVLPLWKYIDNDFENPNDNKKTRVILTPQNR